LVAPWGYWVVISLVAEGIAALAAPRLRYVALVPLTEAVEHRVEQVRARDPPTRTTLGREVSSTAGSLDGLTVQLEESRCLRHREPVGAYRGSPSCNLAHWPDLTVSKSGRSTFVRPIPVRPEISRRDLPRVGSLFGHQDRNTRNTPKGEMYKWSTLGPRSLPS
jgi:hypothetical protein